MKKPRVEKSFQIAQHIDPTKKVRVYRNLHRDCYSVKQGGIVRCHAENVTLRSCQFIVSKAGQRRVRDEKKKNVHAFIEGYVVSARRSLELLDFGWEKVYYNPYKTDHWQAVSAYTLANSPKCVNCARSSQCAHHNKYHGVKFREVPMQDVVALCNNCHENFHEHMKVAGYWELQIPYIEN